MKRKIEYIIIAVICSCLLSLISLAATKDSKQLSRQLTIRAHEELKRHKFESAYQLVQKAINLDPTNIEATSLYMNLYELIEISEKKIILKKIIKKPERVVKKKEPVLKEKSPEEKAAAVSKEDKKTTPDKPAPVKNEWYARIGFLYNTGASDYLNDINTTVGLLGTRLDLGYFYRKTGLTFGFSADYLLNFVKVVGDSRIDFMTHQVNAAVLGRMDFFNSNGRSLVLGLRAGYHLFVLQNNKPEGAYYYRLINGPSFGFFFSEPLLYRIWKNDYIKPFGIEAGINCTPVISDGNSIWIIEYNAALTYDIKSFRIAIGWRSYLIINSMVNESYSGVEISTTYRF